MSSAARSATLCTIEQITTPAELESTKRRELINCWVEVTNKGGAVGFLPPVTVDDIEPVAAAMINSLHPVWTRILIAHAPEGLLGWLALVREDDDLVRHWASIKRLQTHPRHRGRGVASTLMTRARDVARDDLHLEQLHLTARGGMGLESFYERLGWRVIGPAPRRAANRSQRRPRRSPHAAVASLITRAFCKGPEHLCTSRRV